KRIVEKESDLKQAVVALRALESPVEEFLMALNRVPLSDLHALAFPAVMPLAPSELLLRIIGGEEDLAAVTHATDELLKRPGGIPLQMVVQHFSPYVRLHALQAMAPSLSVETLLDLLKSSFFDIRAIALDQLTKTPPPNLVRDLLVNPHKDMKQ